MLVVQEGEPNVFPSSIHITKTIVCFLLTIRDDFRVETECNPKTENTYKNKSLGVVWREWEKSFYLCTNALLYKRWRWRKRKLQDTDALEAKNDAYADDVSHNATCQGVCGGEAGGISCL